MRRQYLLIFFSLFLLSCRLITPFPAKQTTSPTPITTTATVTQKPGESALFDVRVHPEDGLYIGDLVSFEVISHNTNNQLDQDTYIEVELQHQEAEPVVLGQEYFRSYGIGERQQATFNWVWDTTDIDPGDYDLTFRILPEGPEWVETITLFPQDALPPHAFDADWITVESQCCQITYLTGTAAARDIGEIIQIVDKQAAECLDEMAAENMDELHIVLLPRVLGHGGFASGEVYVSYLDRNYTGDNFESAIHHEMIHIIDLSLSADFRPRLFMEGLAVYQTGGHYKTEPLLPRAAALLELGWYIPMEELVEDFYSHQHEIGYLEAGALIEYLIDQWGYEVFDDFYRDIHNNGGGQDRDAIDDALQRHFGISFAELAQEFFSSLQSYPSDTDLREDVVLTVELYDTIRRYQLTLDPSAHFLTAWLITLEDLQSQDIAADYLRHPSQLENLTIETLLISAQDALLEKDFITVREILKAINSSLDCLESEHPRPFSVSLLSERYYEIVAFLIESGYQPQQIQLNSNSAHVQVTQTGPNLISLVVFLNQNVLQSE